MNCFKNILWVLWTGVMVPVLFPWAIAPLPAAGAQGPMLRIEAIPGVDQLVDIQTQVRHTTVIVLPERRKHPRFRCRGFRILASDRRGECGVPETHCDWCRNQRRPNLRVRPDLFLPRIRGRGAPPGRPDRAAARGRHPHIDRTTHSLPSLPVPKSPPIRSWRNRLKLTARNAQAAADTLAAEARAEARAVVEDFRADYPTRLHFVYSLSDRAQEPPFNVEAMWHDGQFTYLRSHAQESPALYEAVDGDPSLGGLRPHRRRPVHCAAHPRFRMAANWQSAGRTGATNRSVSHERMEKDSHRAGWRHARRHGHQDRCCGHIPAPGRNAADLDVHRRGRARSRD